MGTEGGALGGQIGDDVVDVAGGDADVALGFHVGGAVDVADDGGVGVEGFQLSHAIAVDGVGEGAAGAAVGDDDGGVGREDFGGFRHEDDAGEKDDLGLGLLGFEAEEIGVALEVAHAVDDLGLDVGVGEDDGVFLPLEAVDLEGERGDGEASLVVPLFAARIALHVHERAKQTGGLGFDFLSGVGHEEKRIHGSAVMVKAGVWLGFGGGACDPNNLRCHCPV